MSEAHNPMNVVAMCSKPSFWRAAIERDTVVRALKVAAVVGTVLVSINQADNILAGAYPPVWKIILTYCVPYSVSSYSAAAFKVAFEKKENAARQARGECVDE